MFGNGCYATVWRVNNSGEHNYADCQITTSRKDQDGNYHTDFSAFVRFVGNAFNNIDIVGERTRIHILSCAVQNKYDKEKEITYWNPVVFEFEIANSDNNSNAQKTVNNKENTNGNNNDSDEDDGLPF